MKVGEERVVDRIGELGVAELLDGIAEQRP